VEMMKGVETERMNLFTAINDALSIALETDPTSILFGQGE
jgi:2-oxoisovalerate dehydrogenase E1 component beta subunit